MNSYLIEITSQIFRKTDPDTGKPMVDVILDKAGQKGTGIWTLQSAIGQSVVISTINAAVEPESSPPANRPASMPRRFCRIPPSRIYRGPQAAIDAVRDALYASKIVSYAQRHGAARPLRATLTTGTEIRRHCHHLGSGGCIIAPSSSIGSRRLTSATPL